MIFSFLTRIVCVTWLTLGVLGCSSSDQDATPKAAETTAEKANQSANMLVYKSPTCGCCGEWVEHMESAGYSADVHNQENLNSIKKELGILPQVQSCHSAVIDNYVFEGHVPAKLITRFLSEKPKDALGLAVPGMPIGSPGMEMGDRIDPYDVLLLNKDGSTEVYARVDTLQ